MCSNVTVRYALLLAVYVAYVIVGAALFSLIERPKEEELRTDLNIAIDKFLVDHRQCVTDHELAVLLKLVIDVENRGVSATQRNNSMATNWNIGQSIFFAASVITTIGYGNVTPLSDGGKAFCIGYAFIGVILTAVVFDATVLRLMRPTSMLLSLLSRCILRLRCRPRSGGSRPSSFRISLLRLSILFLLLFLLFFVIPSAILDALEKDWTFFDAFYYCFISLTTIGLGDYVPADDLHLSQYQTVYKICVTVYLYLGLIFVLLAVTSVYQVPELNFHEYFSTVTYSTAKEEEEEDDARKDEEVVEDERQYLQPLTPSTARRCYSAARNSLTITVGNEY